MNKYEMDKLRRAACAAARDEVRKILLHDPDPGLIHRRMIHHIECRVPAGAQFVNFGVDRPKPKDFDVMLQGSESFTFYRGEWRRDSEMQEFKRKAMIRLAEIEVSMRDQKELIARFG